MYGYDSAKRITCTIKMSAVIVFFIFFRSIFVWWNYIQPFVNGFDCRDLNSVMLFKGIESENPLKNIYNAVCLFFVISRTKEKTY